MDALTLLAESMNWLDTDYPHKHAAMSGHVPSANNC